MIHETLTELEIMQIISAIPNNGTSLFSKLFSKNKLSKNLFDKLTSNVENIQVVWDCYLSKEALSDSTTKNKIELDRVSLLENFLDFGKILGLTFLQSSTLSPIMRGDVKEDKLSKTIFEVFYIDLLPLHFNVTIEKNNQEMIVTFCFQKKLSQYHSLKSFANLKNNKLTLERHSIDQESVLTFILDNTLLKDKGLSSINFNLETTQSETTVDIFTIDVT